jgi:diguanylate cyclase (GGDEF)-like protein
MFVQTLQPFQFDTIHVEQDQIQSEEEQSASEAPMRVVPPAELIWKSAAICLAGAAALMLGYLLISDTPVIGIWESHVLISICTIVLIGLIALRQENKWVWPVRRINHMLPRIRHNEMSIDSLLQIRGGIEPLAEQVRLLLHELRKQERRVVELNEEMSQRVANRTDALERKIGSLKHQASRDPLTTLLNRRVLDQQLPQLVETCRARSVDLALLMIDVDHFKLLNDTLGHQAGDEMLRDVGQIIRSSIREQDAAFRCGGDEFVVILPGCGSDGGQALAERLCSLVIGLTRTFKVLKAPKLSIGVACLSDLSDPTPHNLMQEADKRLYAVKSAREPKPRPKTAPAAPGLHPVAKAG